ncbi:MAG TPA: hypothetical protein VI383_11590, partial [Gemmatimonadales bacterium]|nr:hypothetical protein [Gemmatimonadales bacterium]
GGGGGDPAQDQREISLLAGSLAARTRLARGDTTGALNALQSLRPTAHQGLLRWVPWEALGWERLTLARLLAGRNRSSEALAVAEGFDSPASIGLIPWVPASLLLREELALTLNDRARALEMRTRYLGLRPGGAPTPARGR